MCINRLIYYLEHQYLLLLFGLLLLLLLLLLFGLLLLLRLLEGLRLYSFTYTKGEKNKVSIKLTCINTLHCENEHPCYHPYN